MSKCKWSVGGAIVGAGIMNWSDLGSAVGFLSSSCQCAMISTEAFYESRTVRAELDCILESVP